jgi:hypothetical protein
LIQAEMTDQVIGELECLVSSDEGKLARVDHENGVGLKIPGAGRVERMS